MAKKKKILWVSEASILRTGFSTYGWNILKRLYKTGKYDIVEFGSYAATSDPRWKEWGIPWKFYGNLPENPQEEQQYKSDYQKNQFGKWKFDDILIREKPDIVVDIRDEWMSEWINKSAYRKYFTWVYMPCVDSQPPRPEWLNTYKAADYLLGYAWYAKWVLEMEGLKVHDVVNPAVDIEAFNPGNRAESLERWGLSADVKPILCVHRNQKRKLLSRMLDTYVILKNEYPEAFKKTVLWLHTSWPDVGFHIPIAMNRAKMGLVPDVNSPNGFKRYKKGLKYSDVMLSYICHNCKHPFVSPYVSGPSMIRNFETGQQVQEHMNCELIYCQKCGKKAARPCNTQVGFEPKDFADVYRAAWVHVQPAIAGADEMPTNEAKACGTPILAPTYAAMHEKVRTTSYCDDDRAKGGLPIKLADIFTEAETMQWRCYFDRKDAAKQLNKVLTDTKLRDLLSKEAIETTNKYYDWDLVAIKWENILDDMELRNKKDWNAPIELKAESADKDEVERVNAMDNQTFVRWCYKKFLNIDKPDEEGFQYWCKDIDNGRTRQNVLEFFANEANKHNNREYHRTGQDRPGSKFEHHVDMNDKFRICVTLSGTAGDLHLLTGTLHSLKEKFAKHDGQIYVACKPQYFNIFKDLMYEGKPLVKNCIPYRPELENAKYLESTGAFSVTYVPGIVTQKFEHYAHNGFGKHLAKAYAAMCDVDLGPCQISLDKPSLDLPDKYYSLHCKTSMNSKDWPMSRFKSLVALFPDITFVQLGGPNEPTLEAPNVVSTVGKTTFTEMAYIIRKAEGHIGLDSVPAHIASTVGTKSLTIMSATYPNICGPMNTHGGIILMPQQRPSACPKPCHMVECPSKDDPCINRVSLRQVAATMEEIF
jgi:ADP-heptose:LPS heptosyltransferase